MDLDSLDLRKLRTFYLVARYGSLRGAATRLNVTVSAVSFSLRRFEEQLGVRLFQRMPNKLVLTDAGERFAESAEAIFNGIGQVLAQSVIEDHPSGRVTVAVNSDIAWHFIPKIGEFLKRYPDVEVGIHVKSSNDALQLLARGEIDLGIGRFSKVPRSAVAERIIESSISLVCPENHPLAQRRAVRLSDLGRYKLVTLSAAHSTRALIAAAFDKAGVTPRGYLEAGNCHGVCEFVAGGLGIGLVHTFCARRDPALKLHYRDLARHLGTGAFSVVYQKQAGPYPALFKKLKEALFAPA